MSEGGGGRIAVVGGGGIGGYVAAELARAGRDITLCVRTPFDRLVVVEGGEAREVSVPIAAEPGAVGAVDWVLLATKAQDVASAAPWLAALAGTGAVTAVLQNGVAHEASVRPYLPSEAPVLPAIVYCSAERTAPGRIVHHGGARLAVPAGPRGAAFAALFSGTAFEVEEEPDFVTVAWRKLLSNAVANPITALTLRRMTVFHDEGIRALARALFAEIVAVGRAAGARITLEDAERVLASYGRTASGSSMFYDRLAGQPLEHAFISGAVVAAAESYGVPAPLNRAILALTAAASGAPLDGTG